MRRSHFIFGVLICSLTGCFGNPDSRSETDRAARPVDESVDPGPVAPEIGAQEANRGTSTEGTSVPKQMSGQPDSAMKTETQGRGGSASSDDSDMERAESQFRELDKAVAMLEVRVFSQTLGEPYETTMSRLHDLRNEVALLLAEAETAPEAESGTLREDLMQVIEELERAVERASEEIDHAETESDDMGRVERL